MVNKVGIPGFQGPPGLVPRGEWAIDVSYDVDDFVTESGSAYLALKAHTGVQPGTDATTWQLYVASGELSGAAQETISAALNSISGSVNEAGQAATASGQSAAQAGQAASSAQQSAAAAAQSVSDASAAGAAAGATAGQSAGAAAGATSGSAAVAPQVAAATTQAGIASAAATTATNQAAIATAAAASKGNFATTALGLAGTTTGQSFTVTPATQVPNALYDLYMNTAGAAVYQGSAASQTTVNTLAAQTAQGGNALNGSAVVDDDGFIGSGAFADGSIVNGQTIVSPAGATFSGHTIMQDGNISVGGRCLVDDDGFIAECITPTGVSANQAPAQNAALQIDLGKRDSLNLAKAETLKNAVLPGTQQPTAQWNVTLVGGQSYSQGAWGGPRKSTVARLGNKMLGTSMSGSYLIGPDWKVLTDATLHDLVANMQDNTGAVISDAAFDPTVQVHGENYGIGAVNFAKRLHNEKFGLDNDTAHTFVTNAFGQINTSIVYWQKSDTTQKLYARFTACIAALKAAAAAAGATIVITEIMWNQGQNDANMDASTYLGYLTQLRSDMVADVLAAFPSQTKMPAWIMTQIGRDFNATQTFATTAKAQLEFCKTTPGCYLATNDYWFPDHQGHLDANSYRWEGYYFGRAKHYVTCLRKPWYPPFIMSADWSGSVVTLDYFVPAPPLVIRYPYQNGAQAIVAGGGYEVIDDQGSMTPTVVLPTHTSTIVQLQLPRPIVSAAGSVTVKVALGAVSGGLSNVTDSDPSVADDTYVYASTDPTTANIAEYIGKPYPLYNPVTSDFFTATKATS